MPMEFRILGPLEVLVEGRPVPLGGARQRAVLAILLVHRGEVVSVDRVVDELWGETPPATATKTVQVYVSHLRKALGEGVLVTRGGGYALELGEDDVDADRFARLARDGRQALERGEAKDGAQTLKEALDLSRGPPLADFAYESFAQNQIGRLEELRLAVLEDRIDADLALGRHAALVPELESLVAEHPGRERLRGQHMLALYRSGRQAEALDSYRDAQRTLVEELGLEPGPELQQLQREILAQDPSLAAPPRPGAVAALQQRRRGGALIALGGALLLAAAVAAIVAIDGDEGSGPAEPNTLAVIDPETNRLVTTVPTGIEPADVSADGEHIWVANHGDDTATQIDPDTREVISTTSPQISVGGLAAGAGAVWVTDTRGSKLVRLDPAFRSSRSIHLARPLDLSVSTTNPVAVGPGAVWVERAVGGVSRIDPATDEVTTTIPVGNGPSAIAAGPDGVWVADDVDNTVTRIDPHGANAATATTPVGQGPSAVAVGEGAVWVVNALDDTVSRIDPSTAAVTATIQVGAQPTGIAAGDGAVWVANSLSGTVSRIDPESNLVAETVQVGEAPHGVTLAHDLVWVSVRAAPTPQPPSDGPDGDPVRVLAESDPGPIDPALASDAQPSIFFATCARLYSYPDLPLPAGAQLQPEVAAGQPSISDGGKTYTFTLRPGFGFSPPSNEPVGAAAFERAIERALSPQMRTFARKTMTEIVGMDDYLAGRSESLAGVSTRDGRLVIRLTEPVPNLAARLAAPFFCAVPPNTPIKRGGVDAVPSAGPYYVASHAEDRDLVLRPNPNYEGERPQGLDEVRYEFGISAKRAIEDVEAGRADYVGLGAQTESAIRPDTLTELTDRYGPDSEAALAGGQQVFSQAIPDLYSFIFNFRRDVFDDVRLRKAVNYAVDRRALADNTGLGAVGRPTDQYLTPGIPGFEDAAIYPLTGTDLEEARRLAGDERREAVFYTCDFDECSRHAQILRANLAAIGIELDVRQFPLGEHFGRILQPGEPWDIAYWNWFVDYADPFDYINFQFGPGASQPSGFSDPVMNRRMAEAARLGGDARLRAYARLDRDLAEKAAPAVAFASGTTTHFLSARMGCQVMHPLYGLDLAALCVRDDADAE